jgi:hypothetical protein
MKEWDILDEVPYKYFKKYDDDDDIDVEIYHIDDDDDRPTYNTIVFEFEFEYDCSGGALPLYTTKKFKRQITYNTSSPFALFLYNIQNDEEEEEESEDTTDDESE